MRLFFALMLWLPSVALAQMCPPTPPDFRPHVEGGALGGDTMVRPGRAIHFDADLRLAYCSYGPAPRRPKVSELRAVIRSGPNAGSELPLRGRTGAHVMLRLPDPGEYAIEIHSRRHPELEPLVVYGRAIDPARAVTTRVRAHLPRAPSLPARLRFFAVDRTGCQIAMDAVRNGDHLEGRVALEPGHYSLVIADPDIRGRTEIDVGAPEIDVTFSG